MTVIWSVSILRTTVFVAFTSGMAVANVNTTNFRIFWTRFELLYSFISKISSRSINCRQGTMDTFKLIHVINLPLSICLARIMQIVTRSKTVISCSNAWKANKFFKIWSLNYLPSVIMSVQFHFFYFVLESTFSPHKVEHYVVSLMGHQHHITVSMER